MNGLDYRREIEKKRDELLVFLKESSVKQEEARGLISKIESQLTVMDIFEAMTTAQNYYEQDKGMVN